MGKRLLVPNDAGQAVFVAPGEKGAVLGGGSLAVGSGATYTFAKSRALMRGGKFLYCIDSNRQPSPAGSR